MADEHSPAEELKTDQKPSQTDLNDLETLNARSEYTTSQDDGAAEHRINQYLIKQEIGRGSFGAVHLAVDQYGQEYAVKEFSKSRLRKRAQSHVLRRPRGARRPGAIPAGEGFNSPLHRHPTGMEGEDAENPLHLIKEEIAIMKKLNHHNLVSLIEVLDDPTEDSLYMVMEMCKKGVIMKVGLEEKADPYDEERCRCWFRDLILGVEYLHAQGVVHRDIKPDNCLLTSDDVLKVVDFGVSEMFEKSTEMYTAKSAGSPAFLPPELCVAKHGDVSGRAADIWSMGVTLYCLRHGRIPFEKAGIFELYEAIRNDEVVCDEDNNEDFKDLMAKILQKDPAARISMPELRDHAWVTKRGTDPLLSAEENTATILEPPTEEEMNSAITKNMGHLLAVIKAVKKFKGLVDHSQPSPMFSILGQDQGSHFVQPPLSMDEEDMDSPGSLDPHKNHSLDIYDRDSKARDLVVSGAHDTSDFHRRKIAKEGDSTFSPGSSQTQDLTSAAEGFPKSQTIGGEFPRPPVSKSPSPPLASDTPTKTSISEGTRGHARDPLEEEHLYLFIGPSIYSAPPTCPTSRSASFRRDGDGDLDITATPLEIDTSGGVPIPGSETPIDTSSVPIVSESPGATDIDIYETAYTEEIERIRSRSRDSHHPEPTMYLTRRVEKNRSRLGDMMRLVQEAAAAEEAGGTKPSTYESKPQEGPSSTPQDNVAPKDSDTPMPDKPTAAPPTTASQPTPTVERKNSTSVSSTSTEASKATNRLSRSGLRGLVGRLRGKGVGKDKGVDGGE
ncbi:hypothetical protein FQN54_007457 [Arachnomyces sp. PD_36]|nr:hypothetical protein FQN54_007457 [Arachnomyces sp. PD_36]